MNDDELLNAIKDNFDDLQCEQTIGELFFALGMDGSSFRAEIEVARTLRSVGFRQRLRASGIDFNFYRNGKLEFVEVTHVE